ncbi:hypothetical protein Tco_0600054 [Tanacetum coccineum]|uniref:Reverse transcriptase Ty1/copia-type domain-containing protein n=1 Tax=Tanacetum coccineum TaxID=301880 RepID=A0ABQ4WAP7_9ASTR
MRDRFFMHTVQNDSILGSLRFVSKSEEYQVYGALILAKMTNRKMRNSTAYKTYLAFATGAATPKKAMKFKKHASTLKKKTLVTVEEPAENPAKKLAARRQFADLKKAITRSKRETNIHQAGGSCEGVNLESEVPDEPKGKTIDTSEATGLKPGVPDVSKADFSKSEYESWGDSEDDDDDDDDRQSNDGQNDSDNPRTSDDEKETQEDEFVHTPDDYVPIDDENVDEEEYDCINKEMYDDVNVDMRDTEPAAEGKDDEEMTHADHVDVGHKNVNQEIAGDQVKYVAQTIVTAAPATQKTEVLLQSSSISSDYATKFLNIDNIPSADTEIISMMDIKVQHEDLKNEVKTLKNVDHISAIYVAIKSEVPTIVKEYIGTSLDDTFHKVIQRHIAELIKEHSILADVVKVFQQQQKPQKSVADIRKIKMEQASKQQETRYTITSSDTAELQEFDQKRTLFETMTKTKSFNKNTKHKALYHALMNSILKDEDAMDKGVLDKSKKRNPNDADRDEGPPARSNQGVKKKKTSKDTEPSKKAKSSETSKCTTKSQPKSTGKSAQAKETVFEAEDTQVPHNLGEDMGTTDEPPIVNVYPKDWFKKPERPPTPDPEWNECKPVDNKPTQKWLSDLAKAEKPSKTFDDLMSSPIDFSAFSMNCLQISNLIQDILNNPEGDRYPFDLSKPLPLVQSRNHQIVPVDYFFNNDLAYLQGGSTGRTYTTSLTKMKASKYDLQGIEDMIPNLVSKHDVYSTKRILAVTNVKFNIWYGYGHLEETEVRRSDKQLYKFMEGDFLRLHLNDIEDTLILVVQNRLFNLKGEDIEHLATTLRMFTRRIVIQK